MHHALHIHEILLNIFGHCCPTERQWTAHRRHSTAVLAALARTCHTFKEPALDVLWSELVDLTPLPQCIPEACRITGRRYSFKRPLNEAEWDVLWSYTRRIWHIFGYADPHGGLDDETLIRICSAPGVAVPLFPNLRTFHWQGTTMIPAAHIAVPSLTTLNLRLTHGHAPGLKDFLDTVGALCPNVNRVRIRISRPHDLDGTICDHIRRLTKLRVLDSDGVTLDADMILRLSEKSALKSLSFTLNPHTPTKWVPSSYSAPIFHALARLETSSRSLEPVTGILSCIRLPVVEDLNANFTACPSKETFGSYISTVRNICSSDSLVGLRIRGAGYLPTRIQSGHLLTLDDVRPCMAFAHLRTVHINLSQWSVELTDSDLLELVSTWPHIRTLSINDEWGWRTTGGITLHGLSQLLQTRRSLAYLCIAIDTQSPTDLAHRVETGFLPPPNPLTVNLADSHIRKPADVPALVEAFWKLGLHTCFLLAWDGMEMEDQEDETVYHRQKHEWSRVFDSVIRGLPGPVGEQGC